MLEILDVCLPIASFVVYSLLTLPIFKYARKIKNGNKKLLLTLVWFSIIYASAAFAVANLATKYYEQATTQPLVNVTFAENSQLIFSSTFQLMPFRFIWL